MKKKRAKELCKQDDETYVPVAGKWPTEEIKMGIRGSEKPPSPRK
jgi:hypothetical protein